MKVINEDVLKCLGTMETDLCARSGLVGIGVTNAFTTVYTTNFERVAAFYKDLFGRETIRFETEQMVVFDVGVGQTLVQSVQTDSTFSKLAGKQSVSMSVSRINSWLEQRPELAHLLTEDHLPQWSESTRVLKDPDGNLILLVDEVDDTASLGSRPAPAEEGRA